MTVIGEPRAGLFNHIRLAAEIDQFAVGAVVRVLSGQHRDRWRHDRQAHMGDMGSYAGEQFAHHLRRLGAALAHVHVRVGAIADIGVDGVDIRRRDIGVQIVGGDDLAVGSDEAAHHRQDRAFGVVVLGGQSGAVHDAIDAVQFAGVAQLAFPLRHHASEEGVLHRPVRLGHRQQAGDCLPGAGRIHVRNEPRHLAEHARRGGTCIVQHRLAGEQRLGGEIRLVYDGGEAVAFDGEAQQGDARFAHSCTPSNSAMRGVAFRPVPVSTSTVVWSGVIAPEASSRAKAADTWAQVGST